MGITWNSMGGWTPGWVDGMEAFHGKAMWRTPWASHGIPWEGGLLDGWMAWRPSMARPCGEHHGHHMEFHGRVDSWMGGWHGGLPWQGHVENTMGITWNSMGGWTPGWVDGMEAFHGKAMWRTPWASHGIPWEGGLLDGWMAWR